MKKIIVSSLLLLAVVVLASVGKLHRVSECGIIDNGNPAIMKSAGPPPYSTNAPQEETCAKSGCHDGVTSALNSGTAIVTLDLGEASNGYFPGKEYIITASVSKPGTMRSGFQITCVRNNNDAITPGIVSLTDTVRTQQRDSNNVSWGCCWQKRVWVTHKYNGITPDTSGYNEWSYKWKAPSDNAGNISFYLAALEANNDLKDTFDYTYTKTKTIGCLAPVADFAYSVNGNTVTFSDSSQGASQYLWNFGGSTSGLKNPSYTFAGPGVFTVCLEATNTCGFDTVCKTIVIWALGVESDLSSSEFSEIEIFPNPNNGKFTISSRQLTIDNRQKNELCKVEIYNILGGKIYQSTSRLINQSTIDLTAQPTGIYIIKIQSGEKTYIKKVLKN